MTFTFDISLATDLAKTRFHIGDTSEAGNYIEDETINALVISEGSVGGAVIACIKFIITQLSAPDFQEDWLEVEREAAREGYEKMLVTKAQEFGISVSNLSVTTSISSPFRADSDQHTSTTRVTTESNETQKYDGRP